MYEQQIARGMVLQDKLDPGWRTSIDLERLDVGECDTCILGQRHGAYSDGLDALGITEHDGPDYGFDVEVGTGYPERCNQLTAEWRNALREPAPAGAGDG